MTTSPRNDKMTTLADFKAAVNKIRDIFRQSDLSIIGMDSMRHLCLYLMARYLTIEKVKELEIPEMFAWENVMHKLYHSENGTQYVFDDFCNFKIDCLIKYFDRLFGTKDFPFAVKSPMKHKEILEILNKIDLYHIEHEMDLLGWVYESHLATGAGKGRDLGQFFTPRDVCRYMVNLCKPKINADGVPESMCDPTMGTGGFITTFMKYYATTYGDGSVKWKNHLNKISGCETDPKVAGVARLNAFIESGGARFPCLETRNSITKDLPLPSYDIILANEPFGLKGINIVDCCEKIKAQHLVGTTPEPKFIQIMMSSLNKGGRCAVIVPESILTQGTKIQVATRKRLLNEFELRLVVKMRGKFFTGTAIQTSILFFMRTGNPTMEVRFIELTKGLNGELIESELYTLPRSKFGPKFELDVKKLMEVARPIEHIEGLRYMKLEDCCVYQNGTILSAAQKAASTENKYPIMCGGKDYNGWYKDFNRDGINISVSKSGSAGLVKWHTDKFWATGCITMQTKSDEIESKYIYYCLKLNPRKLMDRAKRGCTIYNLKWDDFKDVDIPIPSIQIQQAIVAKLDETYVQPLIDINDTIKLTSKAMDLLLKDPTGEMFDDVIAMQRGIVADKLAILSFNAQIKQLSRIPQYRECKQFRLVDVLNICGGKSNTERSEQYTIPYYDSNGPIGFVKEPLFDGEYIITARKLSIGAVHYINGKYYGSDDTINFTTKDAAILNNRYFYYWLKYNNHILKALSHGVKPGIKQEDVKNIMMSLPTIDVQLELLNKFDRLTLFIEQSNEHIAFTKTTITEYIQNYLRIQDEAEDVAEADIDAEEVPETEVETDEIDTGSSEAGPADA